MTNDDRTRVVFHGAVVLLLGLLCGYPAVLEPTSEGERLWHTAHEGLIMAGSLMFAVASTFSALALARREAAGLVASLLAMGYGLAGGFLIGAVTGAPAFSPSGEPVRLLGFLAVTVGIVASLLVAGLVLVGARAARRESVVAARAA